MKKSLIKLDQERLKQKQDSEGKNYLDAVSQKDEAKAADAVIEAQKKVDIATAQDKQDKLDSLKISRRYSKREYIHNIALVGEKMGESIDWPKGWEWIVEGDDTKLQAIFRDNKGKFYGHGFIPCGDSEVDLHAIGVLMTQCENTVDELTNTEAIVKKAVKEIK